MDIRDINSNHFVKFGRTSLTVKDNNGNTKGVVTNCTFFFASAPRVKFDMLDKLRKTIQGINRDDEINIFNNSVIKDGTLYYFYDVKKKEFIEKYGFFDDSEEKNFHEYERLRGLVEKFKIPVIEYR